MAGATTNTNAANKNISEPSKPVPQQKMQIEEESKREEPPQAKSIGFTVLIKK